MTQFSGKAENRGLAIAWMLATMGCFIALDTLMKLGLERYSLPKLHGGVSFLPQYSLHFIVAELYLASSKARCPCSKRGVHFS
jgi:hypothetical protein